MITHLDLSFNSLGERCGQWKSCRVNENVVFHCVISVVDFKNDAELLQNKVKLHCLFCFLSQIKISLQKREFFITGNVLALSKHVMLLHFAQIC